MESLDEPLPVLVALFSKLFLRCLFWSVDAPARSSPGGPDLHTSAGLSRSLQRSALPAVYGVFWEMTLVFWRRFPNFVFDASDWPETIPCGRAPAARKAL